MISKEGTQEATAVRSLQVKHAVYNCPLGTVSWFRRWTADPACISGPRSPVCEKAVTLCPPVSAPRCSPRHPKGFFPISREQIMVEIRSLVRHGVKEQDRIVLVYKKQVLARTRTNRSWDVGELVHQDPSLVCKSLFSAALGDTRLPGGLPQRGVEVPWKGAREQRLNGASERFLVVKDSCWHGKLSWLASMSKKDWFCDFKKKKNMNQVYTTESEQTLAHPLRQSVLVSSDGLYFLSIPTSAVRQPLPHPSPNGSFWHTCSVWDFPSGGPSTNPRELLPARCHSSRP